MLNNDADNSDGIFVRNASELDDAGNRYIDFPNFVSDVHDYLYLLPIL